MLLTSYHHQIPSMTVHRGNRVRRMVCQILDNISSSPSRGLGSGVDELVLVVRVSNVRVKWRNRANIEAERGRHARQGSQTRELVKSAIFTDGDF